MIPSGRGGASEFAEEARTPDWGSGHHAVDGGPRCLKRDRQTGPRMDAALLQLATELRGCLRVRYPD